MVHRQNLRSKKSLSSKKVSRRDKQTRPPISSAAVSMAKLNLSENLDDETKLAKRHLTKEMWQLVSIAVKRMADELVSVPNNQQVVTRTLLQEPQTALTPDSHQTPSLDLPSTSQQPMIKNAGAGDVFSTKEKSVISEESIKRRTIPMQMLESSVNSKKKGISNNATHRSKKSKVKNRSLKNNGKVTTKRLRNNYTFK